MVRPAVVWSGKRWRRPLLRCVVGLLAVLLVVVAYVASFHVLVRRVHVCWGPNSAAKAGPGPPGTFLFLSLDRRVNEVGYYVYWPLHTVYTGEHADAVYARGRDLEFLKWLLADDAPGTIERRQDE